MARRALLSFDCVFKPLKKLKLLIPTDPFAEADEDTGETKQSQNYIHIRIQRTLDALQMISAKVAQAKKSC